MKKTVCAIMEFFMVCLPMVGVAEEIAQPEQMIDLTYLVVGILAVIFGVIAYKIMPYIKNNMSESQRQAIAAAAKIVVYAAEQIFGAGKGEEKLNYALEKLKALGFKVDVGVLRVYVEAAVKEMNIKIK